MRKIINLVMIALLAIVSSSPLFAQNDQQLKSQRIKSSYMLALGRTATQGEVNYWMGRENLDLPQLVNMHTQYLQNAPDEKRKVIIKSYYDSYGKNPDEGLISKNMKSAYNYTQWINNHVAWLKSNSTDFNEMISKVYWNVCGRWATDNDKRSWPQSEAKAYYVTAAIVDNWVKINSSPKNTMGNSKYASTEKVAEIVAREAAGIIGSAAGNVIAPGGGNVVAAGGGNVVAAGGLN